MISICNNNIIKRYLYPFVMQLSSPFVLFFIFCCYSLFFGDKILSFKDVGRELNADSQPEGADSPEKRD